MELNNEFEVAVPVDEAWAVLTDIEKIAPCMPGAELREVEGDEYRGVVKVKVGPITASYRGVARFEELDAKAHKAVLKAEGRETRGQGNASAHITATLSPSGKGTKVQVATDLAITGKVAQFGRGVLADVSGKLLDQFVHNLETTVLAAPSGATPAPKAEGTTATAAKQTTDAGDNGTSPEPAPEPAESSSAPARRGRTKATAAAPVAPATAPGTSTGGEPEARTAGEEAHENLEKAPAGPRPAPADAAPRQISSPPAEPVDLFEVAGGSVMKRLAPYLTVAGILLIARIVVYSLRRRRQ